MSKLHIAVVGAGLIGKTHIDRALASSSVELVAIADPSPAAAELAHSAGVACFADYRSLLKETRPQGVVVATPNSTHAQITVDCLDEHVARDVVARLTAITAATEGDAT